MQASIEISPIQAQQLLESSSLKPCLLDVRRPDEVKICKLSGARHIPLDQLPQEYPVLPKDEVILIYCHHGARSLRAAEFLRAQGFKQVFSIQGGIHTWSQQLDPSIPQY